MRWIKLWTNETIHGTTSKELPPHLRGIWFQLLAMAGLEPCYGKINITEDIAYTNKQLADLLKVPIKDLEETFKILLKPDVNKININGTGIIEIVNWHHYQSQAGYMKSYREGHKEAIKDAEKSKKKRKC